MNNVNAVEAVKKIVIVGGGIVGWSVAVAIRNKNKHCQVLLIDLLEKDCASSTFGDITATLPSIENFHQCIGIQERELLKHVEMSFSLGTQYKNWGSASVNDRDSGGDFFLPFSDHGFTLKGVEFPNYVMRSHNDGETINFDEYALSTHANRANNFRHPSKNPRSLFSTIKYALHFHTEQYTDYLTRYALSKGVNHIFAKCVSANINKISGDIASLSLNHVNDNVASTTTMIADFYIDCSLKGDLLTADVMKEASNQLETNSVKSVKVVSSSRDNLPSSELKKIHLASTSQGTLKETAATTIWSKTLHLTSFSESTFYFSEEISDNQIFKIIDAELGADISASLLLIKSAITLDNHDINYLKPWRNNCLSIGHVSTALTDFFVPKLPLIQADIKRFLAFFPTTATIDFCAKEYNKSALKEIKHIEAFNELHLLSLSCRFTELWQNGATKNCTLKNNDGFLQEKIDLYKARGKIPVYEGDTLSAQHWQGFLMANQCWPQEYDPMADTPDNVWVKEQLDKMRNTFYQAAQAMPNHTEYLRKRAKHAK